jgi:hypothetical protein
VPLDEELLVVAPPVPLVEDVVAAPPPPPPLDETEVVLPGPAPPVVPEVVPLVPLLDVWLVVVPDPGPSAPAPVKDVPVAHDTAASTRAPTIDAIHANEERCRFMTPPRRGTPPAQDRSTPGGTQLPFSSAAIAARASSGTRTFSSVA